MFDNERFYYLSTALGYETGYGPHDVDSEDAFDDDLPMKFIIRECIASLCYDDDDECFKIDTYTRIMFDHRQFDTSRQHGDLCERTYDKKVEYDLIKRMIGYTEKFLYEFGYHIHNRNFGNILPVKTGLYCTGAGYISEIAPTLITNPRLDAD